MLRLSPAVPFNLQNYLYGLTRIGFRPCVLTSWVAMLPGTLMYVYLGHAGRAGLEAASGGRARSPAEWAILVVGLAATVMVTVYVTRLARKALHEQSAFASGTAETSGERADPETPPPGRSMGSTILVGVALVGLSFTDYGSFLPSLAGPSAWFLVFFLGGFVMWVVLAGLLKWKDVTLTTIAVAAIVAEGIGGVLKPLLTLLGVNTQ